MPQDLSPALQLLQALLVKWPNSRSAHSLRTENGKLIVVLVLGDILPKFWQFSLEEKDLQKDPSVLIAEIDALLQQPPSA